MQTLLRLRIELLSGPGALGRFGRAMESLGGSIINIDLQDLDGITAVDDVLVRIPTSNSSIESLGAALREHDAGRVKRLAIVEEATDPVLRSIRWACSIVNGGAHAAASETTRVIGEICSTTDVWLFDDRADNLAVVRDAFRGHQALAERAEPVPEEIQASFCGDGWLLAVPDSCLDPAKVALVARPAGQAFSATETERVEAVLGLYRRTVNSSPRSDAATLPDGPWLDLSVR